MPTPTTVKLLVDESNNEQQNNATEAAWSVDPRLPSNRRTSSGCPALCALACVMFLFGLALGAVIYTYMVPGAFDELLSLKNGAAENGMDFESEDFEMALRSKCPLFPWGELHLPRDVEPESYNLTLHPNITDGHLIGQVVIDIKVLNATDVIVLHALRLNLSSFYINVNGKKVDADHSECPVLQQWTFQLAIPIEEDDEVEMGMEFEGKVLADMHGLYISTHSTANGEQWRSLATQFEPTHARKVFPCFDEPNMKATFQLSVVREPRHVVRSNMNIRMSREHLEEGLYIDVFEKSVKMSTYLLALAVLDNYSYVKKITRNTKEPVEVRLYAPKDVIRGQTEFSLDVAVRALEFFEGYFNISYPLEKADLLALDDFAEGAMENWGLITFRDSALLYNEKTSSVLNKEHIALVVCHEVAHQWFGNLVTMDWWNDLWLNEGFANYMEYKCVDHLFPAWKIMIRFYAENVGLSMEPDGLTSSRAISSELSSNTTNIMSLFDAISYHKAAAIIHMLQGLTGEWYFQKALIEYLNLYAYENAKGEQLWKIVEKHASLPHGVTVQKLAKAFTSQVGYPVVQISLVNNDEEILVHNQSRFLFDLDEEDEDSEWPIPIHFRTKESAEPQLKWLKPGEQKLHWRLDAPSKWIIANTDGVGYFKVLYDKRIYRELIKQLEKEHEAISAIDRTMLLTDAYDFTKVGQLDIGTYMELLSYAEDEDDRMAWTLINRQMKGIEALVEDTVFLPLFRDFQRSLLVRIYSKIGWQTDVKDTPSYRGLQSEILSIACRLKHGDCAKQALTKFNQWSFSRKRVTPELQGIVFEEGVKHGDVSTWEKAYSAYLNATTPTEKQQLMSGMAGSTDPKLIQRLLRMTLDANAIKANVVPRVLAALAENDMARMTAWRFFKINYKKFVKILGEGSNLLVGSIRALVEKMSTHHDLEELKEFLVDKRFDGNKSKLEQMFDAIELNIQWRSINEGRLKSWLEEWDERRRRLHRKRKSLRHLELHSSH